MAEVYLTRKVHFCASHRLHSPHLSAEKNREVFGKCNNENGHGHNYFLKVTLKGQADPQTGMVYNLSFLKEIIHQSVLKKVDHKNLNLDVKEFREINPTSENIAIVIWNWLSAELPKGLLYEVFLQETENNSVTYRGDE